MFIRLTFEAKSKLLELEQDLEKNPAHIKKLVLNILNNISETELKQGVNPILIKILANQGILNTQSNSETQLIDISNFKIIKALKRLLNNLPSANKTEALTQRLQDHAQEKSSAPKQDPTFFSLLRAPQLSYKTRKPPKKPKTIPPNNCAYDAYQTTREAAYAKIKKAVEEKNPVVIQLLSMAVKASLLSEEFYVILQKRSPLLLDGQLPLNLSTAKSEDKSEEAKDKRKADRNFLRTTQGLVNSPDLIKIYLEENIVKVAIEEGYTHVNTLLALAATDEQPLIIWEKKADGSYLIQGCYPEDKTQHKADAKQAFSKQPKDILYQGKNHFTTFNFSSTQERQTALQNAIANELIRTTSQPLSKEEISLIDDEPPKSTTLSKS